MKRLLSTVPVLLLLIASVAVAQNPAGAAQGATKTLVFNLEVLEFSTDLGREIERIAQDRGRIDRLTGEGKVRPVSDVQIRTKPGESASLQVGQRVPIQSSPVQGTPQVQYENTGLNIDISPALLADDRISANIKTNFSSVARTGQNPTYSQRTFNTKLNMKPNEKVILLSVVQQGSLWPSSSTTTASDSAYGNYLLLLTVKVLD